MIKEFDHSEGKAVPPYVMCDWCGVKNQAGA